MSAKSEKILNTIKKTPVVPFFQISNNHVETPKDFSDSDGNEEICFSGTGRKSLMHKFCLDSSLHGLKYLGQPKRYLFERIFWLSAFAVSVVACITVICKLWTTYWEFPIVTVFQPTEMAVDIIPFPAITVCNVNNVRRSRANQYIERAKIPNLAFEDRLKAYGDMYDLNHICEASTTFAQRFNVSMRSVLDERLIDEVLRYRDKLPPSDPIQVLRKATQNCGELILLCLWLDEIQDCETFFRGVETDYGFCCIFNVVPLTLLQRHRPDSRDDPDAIKEWDKINKENKNDILMPAVDQTKNKRERKKLPKYPYRQIYHGRSSGLSLLLNPDLDEYFCRNTDAIGFVIGAGSSLDFPRVRDHGIAVRPNSETFMSIKPDLTIADPSIFSLSLNKRQCYLSQEYSLKYYSYYTESNCVDECISNHTFLSCNCVQYYMPRSSDQKICSPDQFQCTEEIRKEIVQKGLLRECRTCLPSCSDISYQVETTFLDMHNQVFTTNTFPKLNATLNGRNMTIVHLYMGVVSSYPRLRKELYSFIDLVSSTGGLLSLCLGFSVLSVLEICYFGTIRVFINAYKRYTRNGLHSTTISRSKPRFVSAPFRRDNKTSTAAWNNNHFRSEFATPNYGLDNNQKFGIDKFQILK